MPKDGRGKKIKPPAPLPQCQIICGGKPRKYDTPGCCDKVFMTVAYTGECWATYIEAGGPGMESYDEPVYFCPFCGTKLDDNTPVQKR